MNNAMEKHKFRITGSQGHIFGWVNEIWAWECFYRTNLWWGQRDLGYRAPIWDKSL